MDMINSLPDENLTEIFLMISEERTNFRHVHIPLAGVCSRWRSIVTSDSRFWNDLMIDGNPLERIHKWIRYSQGRIKHLRFRDKLPLAAIAQALARLAQTCEPLEELQIEREYIHAFVTRGSRLFSLGHLRSLYCDEWECSTNRIYRALFFGPDNPQSSTPKAYFKELFTRALPEQPVKLERLVHVCSSPENLIICSHFPVLKHAKIRLTNIGQQPLRMRIFLDFLVACKDSLEVLKLELQLGFSVVIARETINVGRSHPVVLPRLRHLELYSILDTKFHHLISALRLPSLISLGLSGFHRPVHEYLQAISPPNVLDRIETLHISSCQLCAESILKSLSGMRRLTYLALCGAGTLPFEEPTNFRVNKILDGMAESIGTGSEICPFLQHLDISYTTNTAESCLKLVLAKKQSVTGDRGSNSAPIRSLKMDMYGGGFKHLLGRLKKEVPLFTSRGSGNRGWYNPSPDQIEIRRIESEALYENVFARYS